MTDNPFPTPSSGLVKPVAGHAPTTANTVRAAKEIIYELHQLLIELAKRLDDIDSQSH